MEPIFLTCMVIAYFFTKGKVDTAAYANGKESPGVAKARMRHATGGGARSASGRPKGKGALRLMMADRWANACESSRQRGEHKAKRRRAWYAETAPQRDAAWREKQLRKLRRAEEARNRWAGSGLIDLSEFRDRKAEEEAWKENERRNAEAAAATTDPAAAPTGTDPATPAGDPATGTDPAKPDEAKPTEDAATDGTDETKPDAEKAEEPKADETKAEDSSTTPTEPQPAAGTDPAGTGEAAKADTPAGAATTPKNSDAAGKAGDSVYDAAADRLINAAERVEQYRADLAAMADGLDGKKWGVEVHGPIRDMDGHLSTVASTYRDLAGQMQQQGDSVSDAHDAHPYVPADAEVVFA